MIRKGEILGQLTDPEEFFDRPSDKKELEELQKKSALLANLVRLQLPGSEEEIQKAEEERTRIRTDFRSGVPPQEENHRAGVHVRDEEGNVPDRKGQIAQEIATVEEETALEPEDYGPKTAAMPDNTVYPSEKMRDLLDIGSLPEHLQERAWSMLSK
jgi:hypothetical protein